MENDKVGGRVHLVSKKFSIDELQGQALGSLMEMNKLFSSKIPSYVG